ncbi:MAG: hypothetical protein ACR2FH_11635 [Caulobacteraceae bacterium]
MRRNPAGDWQIDDVAVVCRTFGLDCVAPTRGSHHRIAHPEATAILTIPARRPIKPMYIRALVAYIDEVGGAAKHE